MADTCVRYAEYFYRCHAPKEQEKLMMLIRGVVFDQIQQLPVETGRKCYLAEEVFGNIREIIEVGAKDANNWED